MGFISANRTQGHLFGYHLEDFVPPDARCRHVVRYTERLDLSALYADYSSQGGDAFDPRLMLGIWFYAYSEGITSTRKVERLCQRDMHFIYVSGRLRPDHTSLSRFRQRHADRLADLFVQILRFAIEDRVSDFEMIAIDGTKIESWGSRKQLRTGEQLARQLEGVRGEIQGYLQQCELLDESSEPQDVRQVQHRIQELQALEQKLLDRQRMLEDRKKALQLKDREKHKINLTEPEARSMSKVNGKKAVPAYNAQVSVDTDSGLIVAQDVTDAPTDQQQFGRQHHNVQRNLPENPERKYVADAGYNSLEQLEYVEREQVEAVIADPRPEHRPGGKPSGKTAKRYPRSMFQYEPQSDRYRCPAGKILSYWYTDQGTGTVRRVYTCKDCPGCPHQSACLGEKPKRARRTVWRDERESLAETMSQKSHSQTGQELLAIRSQTVEPVIGNVKSNLGFRRFCRSGLAAVRAEWALMCIAHNLNRLIALARRQLLALFSTYWSYKLGEGPAGRILPFRLGCWPVAHCPAA